MKNVSEIFLVSLFIVEYLGFPQWLKDLVF